MTEIMRWLMLAINTLMKISICLHVRFIRYIKKTGNALDDLMWEKKYYPRRKQVYKALILKWYMDVFDDFMKT